MRLSAGCEMVLEIDQPGPISLVLMLRPSSSALQWVSEERHALSPMVTVLEYLDNFGNICQRMQAPAGRFSIATQVTVETAATLEVAPGTPLDLVSALPDKTLQYLLPSRYCQSDLVGERAREITHGCKMGYDQAEAIRAWIQGNIEYCYNSSDASTSALETLRDRKGVCRDFAHLGIALCRSLTMPARMVVGYLHELVPMDLHAWFEVFVGGRWFTFDATQEQPRGGRIVIAYGRDAADVAMLTQFGASTLTEMGVWVKEA
ncbi:MAG: transglutaminase family protein [Armatimonadetes bacterium]|nr:transglutaminase family protein [Armatimonadota bacterium]